MKYYTKPGVVPVSCCDMYYLVTPNERLQINETAALYWESMKGGASVEEMAEKACDLYELSDITSVQNEITAFIEQLLKKELVTYD